MKYIVVEKNTVYELNEEVNTLIKEGYEPVGSHKVVVILNACTYYSQTLIKRDTDSIENIQSMLKELAKKANEFISPSDFSKF